MDIRISAHGSAAPRRARPRWPLRATLLALGIAAILGAGAPAARAQTAGDVIVDAREAMRKKDRSRLAANRAAAIAAQHPLAMWADYWELGSRLGDVSVDDVEAFYRRWPGSYVEDRLRNDWLLELGRRRDWAAFAADFPRFRMNDDPSVTCYALLTEHLAGHEVRDAARAAWYAQRDADDACALLAQTLIDARQLTPADAWRKARLAFDANRGSAVRSARQAAAMVGPDAAAAVQELVDSPARYLARKGSTAGRTGAELVALALMRMATTDADAAAEALSSRWSRALPPDLASWAWAAVGKQSALKLSPDAADQFQRAEQVGPKDGQPEALPDEMLAWKVRAALRANNGRGRWQQVLQAINAMSEPEQKDAAWIYWKGRALQALARDSQDGEAMRTQAREMLAGIAGPLHFYGALAADAIGVPVVLPPRPQALSADEREAAARNPGLRRALQLIGIGLRNEGVREWNFTLRGMSERELLAAAQLACDQQVWDRCINTSDRTRNEIDIEQRFPTPFRKEVVARATEIGLDPAYVYGLIRQESRFVMDARSSVGASGLMQIMPATARWTAKKIGLDYSHDLIADRDTNLKLGTSYLKLVLDDMEGSQPMAAAAYNAGPGRPRKWREGPLLEPAAWAENIPFNETRDYVKKVLSNASIYAAVLGLEMATLKSRLGRPIGPRDGAPPAIEKDMP